jgi:phage anti-repressor protein
MDTLTTVYINGKKVSKEEMQDYEVHIDQAKKIMVGKLTRKSK